MRVQNVGFEANIIENHDGSARGVSRFRGGELMPVIAGRGKGMHWFAVSSCPLVQSILIHAA